MFKIAVTGPESTGKSLLCAHLAKHFNCDWVPEFARDYLANLKQNYALSDLKRIAEGHLTKELNTCKTTQNKTILFIDTDFINLKIWSEHKFQQVDPFISQNIAAHRYDFTLLCYPDLPWEYDTMRENPDLGTYFFNLFEEELIRNKQKFAIIKGKDSARFKLAITELLCFLEEQTTNSCKKQ